MITRSKNNEKKSNRFLSKIPKVRKEIKKISVKSKSQPNSNCKLIYMLVFQKLFKIKNFLLSLDLSEIECERLPSLYDDLVASNVSVQFSSLHDDSIATNPTHLVHSLDEDIIQSVDAHLEKKTIEDSITNINLPDSKRSNSEIVIKKCREIVKVRLEIKTMK